ncbi:hypothetical protein CLU83_1963 [Flavobacterium sp. 1]|uniref:hypothetical protein n=1 Tax=Flavobacterium sp. 1 TaxID=2035200 RepID=UPI000C24F354|nr:hypothetical protein [Flavobacterium sp. 1]PJJ08677.1 hypothetical protein CLU83_1963 [Flavobacterium sp. 1]
MDTERDENQNFKNNIDPSENYLANADDTQESLKQNWYDDELAEDEAQENTDYTDDQNNSSTGYTEKLLEKELTVDHQNKDNDAKNDSDIEEDFIVKNGIIIDRADENNSNQENDQ